MGVVRSAMWIIAVLVWGGCSTHAVPATVNPDAAAAAVAGTAPDRPVRVIFGWRALDGDARFSGRGAARIEPPYRARLDLFGPRGDTYLSAALVDGEVRLPPGLQATQLPPPSMMWAVLGVVRPPEAATLLGTREQNDRVELFYDVDGSRLRYTLEGGRLRGVEWEGPGRKMVVELSGTAAAGLPEEGMFRDWTANTQLVLNLERVDDVEPFPSDIWTPGR